MAHSLTLWTGTGIQDAMGLPVSEAAAFMGGRALKAWQKHKEAEQKLQLGIAERLNVVVRAIGQVVKAVAQTNR